MIFLQENFCLVIKFEFENELAKYIQHKYLHIVFLMFYIIINNLKLIEICLYF